MLFYKWIKNKVKDKKYIKKDLNREIDLDINFTGKISCILHGKRIVLNVLMGMVLDQPYKYCVDYISNIISHEISKEFISSGLTNFKKNNPDYIIVKAMELEDMLNEIKTHKAYKFTRLEFFQMKSQPSIMEEFYED